MPPGMEESPVARKPEPVQDRLDDAPARWLYYIAGNTQDEIARKLGVSRQTAQRLVSLAVSERLIKVRLDHPIGHCLELSERLKDGLWHRLLRSGAVRSRIRSPTTLGVAEAAAAELERYLVSQHPVIVAMGTGRTLRAMVEQVTPDGLPAAQGGLAGRQHRAGWLGHAVRCGQPHRRPGEGAALSHAVAGDRHDGA